MVNGIETKCIFKNVMGTKSTLVIVPANKNVIGTKWIFRNKLNENGEVVRKKERLILKGYA